MLALTREIALLGLAVLAVLALAGCGDSNTRHATASADKSASAKAGLLHGVDMFAVPQPPSGQEQEAVVRVGSKPITRATVLHWYRALTPKIASYEPKSRVDCSSERAPGEVKIPEREAKKLSSAQIQALCLRQKRGEVKESALQRLISYEWVLGEAEELGMGVSEAEAQQLLDSDVAKQFKSRSEFLQYVAEIGRTVADERLGVRLKTAGARVQDLIKRKAESKLTQAAIARYYHEHEKSFSTPEERDIRAVRTWTHPAIAKAMAEVRSGKSIAGVAERVSIDQPSNKEGGLIANIARGQEENGLDQAIFAARPHVLTGPLHLRKRYYAFEVVKITPERKTPFKEIEAKVRETLSKELFNRETASFIKAFREKWLARTSCKPGYVISHCREWRGPSVVVSESPYDLK